jgi:hypothetical protein
LQRLFSDNSEGKSLAAACERDDTRIRDCLERAGAAEFVDGLFLGTDTLLEANFLKDFLKVFRCPMYAAIHVGHLFSTFFALSSYNDIGEPVLGLRQASKTRSPSGSRLQKRNAKR